MSPLLKLAMAAFVATAIAACAQTPPPPPDYPPLAKRPYDAKTQLETGRRY